MLPRNRCAAVCGRRFLPPLRLTRYTALKQIIIKSALSTLGIVAGCAVVVFAVLSFGFPGTLCGWCEQLGNYGFAVKYASLYYSYTDDIADLARCAEDSILSEKDGYITEYCTMLVDDEGFEEYCAERDEQFAQSAPLLEFSYRHYIYGAVAEALYRGGDAEAAVGFAVEALDPSFSREQFTFGGKADYSIESFPVNNALGSLSLYVIECDDAEVAQGILSVYENISPSLKDTEYFNTLSAALGGLADQA